MPQADSAQTPGGLKDPPLGSAMDDTENPDVSKGEPTAPTQYPPTTNPRTNGIPQNNVPPAPPVRNVTFAPLEGLSVSFKSTIFKTNADPHNLETALNNLSVKSFNTKEPKYGRHINEELQEVIKKQSSLKKLRTVGVCNDMLALTKAVHIKQEAICKLQTPTKGHDFCVPKSATNNFTIGASVTLKFFDPESVDLMNETVKNAKETYYKKISDTATHLTTLELQIAKEQFLLGFATKSHFLINDFAIHMKKLKYNDAGHEIPTKTIATFTLHQMMEDPNNQPFIDSYFFGYDQPTILQTIHSICGVKPDISTSTSMLRFAADLKIEMDTFFVPTLLIPRDFLK